MRELAEKAGNVVTFNSIKKYEDGLMTPEPTTMIALANALGVKVEYFMRPIKVELGNVDFRKKASLRAKDIIAIKEQIRDFLERYLEVEEILGITSRFQKPQSLPLVKAQCKWKRLFIYSKINGGLAEILFQMW
ncbi:MAG: helix-turn-helix transcriptional regulator [Spirosomataceae bacterium]